MNVKGIIKDTLIIFAITLVAGGVLGFVYELTKEPILIQQMEKQASACSAVFEEADENGEMKQVADLSFIEIPVNPDFVKVIAQETEIDATVDAVYEARTQEDALYGYIVSVITKEGYGGAIRFYMGISMDGTLKGISILEIHETPGLGMRASEVLTPQFRNVTGPEFAVTKNGKTNDTEIDAITSATITSKAVTRGVNFGMKYFEKLKEGGEQ